MNELLLALLVAVLIMSLVGYLLLQLSDSPVTDETGSGEARSDRQIIEHINQLLPQTQCAQCGYPGCRPYAEAIINTGTPINKCPPGGTALIAELADYLGVEALPLDDTCGETKPAQLAFIIEEDCIGCVLCINACPVDAIVGTARHMHTVIADQCTGCELCIPPCPVDCIELHPVEQPLHRWQWPRPA